jgi:hypothetical protein
MKSIIVKNLMIQFDSFNDSNPKEDAIKILEAVNDSLQLNFPENQPQLFVNAIDLDDIEVADTVDGI